MAIKKSVVKQMGLDPTVDDVKVTAVVNAAPNSLELTRDAKGNPKWSIKLYGESGSIDDLVKKVLEIDESLRDRFFGDQL